MTHETGIGERLRASVLGGLKAGLSTIWLLARVMVPVSLGVMLLERTGGLAWLSGLLAPALSLLGLPGEAAIAIVSSIFLNIYSAIAAMSGMGLDLRQVTIVAIFTLTAHNMIVETAVMRKSGSGAARMVLLRLFWAALSAWFYHMVLPAGPWGPAELGVVAPRDAEFLSALGTWALSTSFLMAKVALLVVTIMVLQRVLEEFGVLAFLSRALSPFLRIFGLPPESSFLWVVINTAGYAYGAAVIIARVEDGKMKSQDGDLLNHHAAVCHSLLEDTALYGAVGVPLFWITVPRLVMAFVAVWAERARRFMFRRSLRAGVK